MEQFTIEELRAIRNLAGNKALGMKRLKDETEERKALRKAYNDLSAKAQNEIFRRHEESGVKLYNHN